MGASGDDLGLGVLAPDAIYEIIPGCKVLRIEHHIEFGSFRRERSAELHGARGCIDMAGLQHNVPRRHAVVIVQAGSDGNLARGQLAFRNPKRDAPRIEILKVRCPRGDCLHVGNSAPMQGNDGETVVVNRSHERG